MFNSLPRGFVHQQALYLFDDTLGCVYVIEQMGRRNLSHSFLKQEDITLKRVSLPYERFFLCDKDLYPPKDGKQRADPTRCEATIK